MKNKIKNLFKNIWESIVVRNYVSSGLYLGDLVSYSFLGTPHGIDDAMKKFAYWEGKYVELGYKAIPRQDWVGAGGYGFSIDHLLRVNQD
jgi:hypothetical protein